MQGMTPDHSTAAADVRRGHRCGPRPRSGAFHAAFTEARPGPSSLDAVVHAPATVKAAIAHIRASDASYIAEARFDSRKSASYREHLTSGLVFSKVPVFIFGHHLDAKLSHLIIRGYLTPQYAGEPIPFPGERK